MLLQQNIIILQQKPQLQALITKIRNPSTKTTDFTYFSDRIIRLLIEEALNLLELTPITIQTNTNTLFQGKEFKGEICGISILRAGEAMENALKDCCRGIRIGKILIQRNENTQKPHLFFYKLPKDVDKRTCFVLDPMLATGGSAILAIGLLIENGVLEQNIIFVNVISCPEDSGLEALQHAYPLVKIVTASVDQGLNDQKYIVPGLGDFGCRYFGTD